MRKVLVFCSLWHFQPAISQIKPPPPVVTNPQTFGYVNGTRIDSLNAEYATFDWGLGKLFFDFGQSEPRKKTAVTDEKGVPCMFVSHSLTFTLNFLYFNGWELNHVSNMDVLILRKRHDQ